MYLFKLTILSGFIFAFTLVQFTGVSLAQNKSDLNPADNFSPTLGLTTMHSPYSFQAWGKMQNTKLTFLKIQYAHTQVRFSRLKFNLISEFIFTGYLQFPVDGKNGPRENLFGFGFTPLRLNIPLTQKHHYPFLTTSAGMLITDRRFPNGDGSSLNFLLDAGIGYSFRINEGRKLQLGYQLHHLSNGNTKNLNPGIDSHMFFINYSFND